MLHLAVTMHVLGHTLADRARTKLTTQPERGSDLIVVVLWAAAAVVLGGIVLTAITTVVNREVVKIK